MWALRSQSGGALGYIRVTRLSGRSTSPPSHTEELSSDVGRVSVAERRERRVAERERLRLEVDVASANNPDGYPLGS